MDRTVVKRDHREIIKTIDELKSQARDIDSSHQIKELIVLLDKLGDKILLHISNENNYLSPVKNQEVNVDVKSIGDSITSVIAGYVIDLERFITRWYTHYDSRSSNIFREELVIILDKIKTRILDEEINIYPSIEEYYELKEKMIA